MKKCLEDIRVKTKTMNREQAAEYVLTYYWYHILLGTIALGLILLLIYHIGWGNQKKEFTCVIVNQEVDFSRDAQVLEEFSAFSGIQERKLSFDSDYLISYADVQLEGENESSYEKFFFNWSAGVIDAMIMPESFLRYCQELDGIFADLGELVPEEELTSLESGLYKDSGQYTGIYIEESVLKDTFETEGEDPLLLVFPAELKHKEICRKFLQYTLGME